MAIINIIIAPTLEIKLCLLVAAFARLGVSKDNTAEGASSKCLVLEAKLAELYYWKPAWKASSAQSANYAPSCVTVLDCDTSMTDDVQPKQQLDA